MKHLVSYEMKRTKRMLLILAGLCMLTSIFCLGCRTKDQTADMHIYLSDIKNRTAQPEESTVVDHYTLNGVGPEAHVFSISSETKEVTISNLVVGDWQVSVVGYSSGGIGIVHGESIISLTSSDQSGTIELGEFYGSGDAQITITYDDFNTILPYLQTTVKLEGSPDTPTILTADSQTDGNATYSLSDYDAGSYLLHTELFSDGSSVSSDIETIRIIDGVTTECSLDLIFDRLQMNLGITIVDDSSAPVSGSITGIPLTLQADAPIEVTFSPDPDSLQSGLTCTWFLNGVETATGNPATITPSAGTQRLKVLVTSDSLGSSGTTYLDLEVVDSLPEGSLYLYHSYTDAASQELLLDGISDIICLPDGLFVTASLYSDALQTIEIVDNELLVQQTITLEDNSLLDNPETLACSGDGAYVAVWADQENAVSIYHHTTNSNSLDLVQTILSTGSSEAGSYVIGNSVGKMAFDSDGSVLLIGSNETESVLQFVRSDTLFDFQRAMTYVNPADNSSLLDPEALAIGYFEDIVAVAMKGSSSLAILNEPSGTLTKIYTFNNAFTNTVGLASIRDVMFVNNIGLITISSDSICEFECTESLLNPDTPELIMRSRLNDATAIPVEFSPKDMDADSSADHVYAITSTGLGLVSFDHDKAACTLSYDSFMSTGSKTPNCCCVSSDDQFMLIGCTGDDTLLLCKFLDAGL